LYAVGVSIVYPTRKIWRHGTHVGGRGREFEMMLAWYDGYGVRKKWEIVELVASHVVLLVKFILYLT
jgi:hypothetical protein